MLEVFEEMDVPVEVSIVSAHHNPDSLPNYEREEGMNKK